MRLRLGWWRNSLGALAAVIFFSGCATTTKLQVPDGFPVSAQVPDLVFYPQESDQCGPESLATLLQASGVTITPDELSPMVYLPEKQGSLAVELVAQARQQGRLVYPLEPQLEHIMTEVAAGRPVMILQNLGFRWWPQWHFAVVVGFDLQRGVAILHSGKDRAHETRLGLLQRTWRRGGSWAVVLMRDGAMPTRVNAARYLQAAADLEETGQTQAAHAAFTSATDKWPLDALAWFGRGNTAYTLGNYQEAEQAFNRVLTIRPDDVGAWNNLAYTQLRLGCPLQAQRSIACAASLDPSNQQVKSSAREINDADASNARQSCSSRVCPVKTTREGGLSE